jgi:hypothetical protein
MEGQEVVEEKKRLDERGASAAFNKADSAGLGDLNMEQAMRLLASLGCTLDNDQEQKLVPSFYF